MRVITMTAYRRPDYTRQVLAALAVCRGVKDWLLLANVEPGHEDVIEQFRAYQACETRLTVNRVRAGLNVNTQNALLAAVRVKAEVIVHLEDDTVPSPDALEYFEWAVRQILIPNRKSRDGHQILLASGYHKPKGEPRKDHGHVCGTRPIWSPWGWAVDRSRLLWMLGHWCTGNPKCFTCKFKSNYRRTRREVYPLLSRIQNIGYELGENGRSPDWYRTNHRTPWVAGDLPPGQFLLPRR